MVLAVLATAVYANGQRETGDDEVYYGQGNGLRDGSGAGQGGGRGQGSGTGRGAGQGSGRGNSAGTTYREDFVLELSQVYGIEPGSGVVNQSEIEGLAYMREEEKLARDVYMNLYETWNLPVFNNIAESEQQHMDAVKMILDAYNVSDSALSAAGKFNNPDLQKLYNDLTKQGSESLTEALKVGATIEDLDIYDLQRLLAETENDELKVLYQNLMKGSRNHLRSFTAQLERNGTDYEAAFITEDYYSEILRINREMAPISNPDYSL